MKIRRGNIFHDVEKITIKEPKILSNSNGSIYSRVIIIEGMAEIFEVTCYSKKKDNLNIKAMSNEEN